MLESSAFRSTISPLEMGMDKDFLVDMGKKELPDMLCSTYTSNRINLSGDLGLTSGTYTFPFNVPYGPMGPGSIFKEHKETRNEWDHIAALEKLGPAHRPEIKQEEKKKVAKDITRRLVKVIIVDANKNISLDKALLYSGEEQFTDLTDEELFYEINLKPLLEKHNETRVKTLDKDATRTSGRDVYLEAAKIRDLSMTVVTIAGF